MGFLAKFFFFSLGISNLAKAEYDATDALREFMRTQDPGTTHSTTVQSLRGATFDIDNDLRDALRSARLSTVQAAMEHALNAKPGEFDEKLFNDVKRWYNELDKRMGLLKYCNRIRGQGWDGECLVKRWYNELDKRMGLLKYCNGYEAKGGTASVLGWRTGGIRSSTKSSWTGPGKLTDGNQ
eukprot:CAMPEP_0172648358 /NCGR_PEP_ID=MMETSP1068-20121228/241229_1 /TAXON_ID=35684 /ORGANISM="Pseudopedinella elastica, Strain CCMP716" /LENGTH=181 /DNA_ID=CAMNT_0013462677 /DNA_START=124 /DNA_END=670 /DNA_ORIENTATION=-